MPTISRRDFLKLASVTALNGVAATRPFVRLAGKITKPNFILILFDAMSAMNLSLYGYPRDTSPSLRNFADRSTVYHTHYSAGNFTTTGTASMLTGTLPWRHRAFHYGGLIVSEMIGQNPNALFGEEYYRVAYCQNPWADRLVGQFYGEVDRFLPMTAFSLRGNTMFMDQVREDRSLVSLASDEFLFTLQDDAMGSSLLGYLYKSVVARSAVHHQTDPRYPKGLPEIDGYAFYTNQDVFGGVQRQVLELDSTRSPFYSYFHLYSPHFPYKPDRRHLQLFDDGLSMAPKPVHQLNASKGYTDSDLFEKRTRYDQQIAHVDSEFGKLIAALDSAGIFETSYVIVTSDHGEMFERGFFGHGERMLYEPAIRIPLLIHAPGQTSRKDVFTPTSNIDLLPTLHEFLGKNPPSAIDGNILPGLGGVADGDRTIFSMEASQNSAFQPITRAVIAMRKGNYKLMAYPGYFEGDEAYELYDLAGDPEERENLAARDEMTLQSLREEYQDSLADANRHFVLVR